VLADVVKQKLCAACSATSCPPGRARHTALHLGNWMRGRATATAPPSTPSFFISQVRHRSWCPCSTITHGCPQVETLAGTTGVSGDEDGSAAVLIGPITLAFDAAQREVVFIDGLKVGMCACDCEK